MRRIDSIDWAKMQREVRLGGADAVLWFGRAARRQAGERMNLRALRYLIALAECLNFSRAADRCAVTQSTLSIQLRKLENYLGVALFVRDRTHVELTAQGREVLRLARVVVTAADEIVLFSRHQARDRNSEQPPGAS
jgi:LysR family hydrogen peroxide-inducible transcriptional activator